MNASIGRTKLAPIEPPGMNPINSATENIEEEFENERS